MRWVFYGFSFLQLWGLNPGSGSCSISILLLENNTQPWSLLYWVNFPCCRLSPSGPYGLSPVAKGVGASCLLLCSYVLETWSFCSRCWKCGWRSHREHRGTTSLPNPETIPSQCTKHLTPANGPCSQSQLSKMCGECLSVKAALQFLEGHNPPWLKISITGSGLCQLHLNWACSEPPENYQCGKTNPGAGKMYLFSRQQWRQ